MEKDFKHLRVKESTHKKVKTLSATKGIKVDETISFLIDFYNHNKLIKKDR